MLKKVLKISAIVFLVLFLILLILPFAFKGKITEIAKEQINNQVNANVGFNDLSLSLIKHFPSLTVDLKGLSVINKAPFKGDTLVYIGHTYLDVNLASVISGKYKVNKISVVDVLADVKVNKDSIANYDITLPSESKEVEEETQEESTSSSDFKLAIDEYEFKNINIYYTDEVSDMSAKVVNFNHNGTGDLTLEEVQLETHTHAEAISFYMGEIAYLKDVQLKYDAEVGVNLADDLKLTFENNKAHINDLHLGFDGSFVMLEEGYQMNFEFSSVQSAFKSLLSLVPNAYTKDFPNVQADGALDVHGKVDGIYNENSIPTFDLTIATENASVKYPDLPKKIENIHVHAQVNNPSGVLDDTQVEVKDFGFRIDKDEFNASTSVTTPISNATIKAAFNGQVNLDNLEHAYPMPPLDYDLQGLVKANISTAFDMKAIEKEAYDKIKSKGSIQLSNVEIGSEYTPNPIDIEVAELLFSTKKVDLTQFNIKTGKSDIQLKGDLENMYGFAFKNQELKGTLNATSGYFDINDFLIATDSTAVATEEKTEETPQDSIPAEQIKIPENIDFTARVNFDKIVYDKIEMNYFKGTAKIKDQKVMISNANTQMFQGTMGVDGYVDTKPDKTFYDFKLSIKKFDIVSAFEGIDMLGKIAPIAKAFVGKFDTDLDIKGDLGNDFMPDMNSLTGLAAANLNVDKVDASKNKFLSLADQKMSFLDLDKTDLKDLKGKFSFEGGKANLAPMDIKYKDIPMKVSGSHRFDNNIDYNLHLDLPAKYLGKEAASLVSKLSSSDQQNVTVPLNVKVGGTITSPTVVPGMKDAVSALTKKAVDAQKKKVEEKVKKEATKKINKLLGIGGDDKKSSEDSKKDKDDVREAGKKLLKGLFGK